MLTPKEALDSFNTKFTVLPKGATVRTFSDGIIVGNKDLAFVLSGESLAHGEEFMFLRAKDSLKSLKEEFDRHDQNTLSKMRKELNK